MVACEHQPGARCWLCSDQRPWWRAARLRAGLSEVPPHLALRTVRVLENEPNRCMDCGVPVGRLDDRCRRCHGRWAGAHGRQKVEAL